MSTTLKDDDAGSETAVLKEQFNDARYSEPKQGLVEVRDKFDRDEVMNLVENEGFAWMGTQSMEEVKIRDITASRISAILSSEAKRLEEEYDGREPRTAKELKDLAAGFEELAREVRADLKVVRDER